MKNDILKKLKQLGQMTPSVKNNNGQVVTYDAGYRRMKRTYSAMSWIDRTKLNKMLRKKND